MKATLITLAAIVGIGLIALCMLMSSRNGAINLEEQVNTAKSGIDVQLSNRFNKLHELAACVKKYDEHEYQTLVKVIEARGKNMSGAEAKQCIAAFSRVEERYPDLKSQKNYQHLMNDISITENHLAQHKKAYNETVRDYSYYCRKFPTSMFLSITGYIAKDFKYYEAEEHTRDTKPLELF
jgi:LemA protein